MMDVMIGVDPHKGSHTATMLDRAERELGRIKVRAGRRQLAELLDWATGTRPALGGGVRRRDGLSAFPALVAAGETVLDVPATLASRVRLLSTGQSTKTDPNDARSVAVAALRHRRWPRCDRLTMSRVPVVGQASQRSVPLAEQAVLPAARPRRRAGAPWDRQRSSR